jgi:flagellar basal body rod protein FlgG
MKPSLWLFAMLLMCGCVHLRRDPAPVDAERWAFQEQYLRQRLTNQLSQTSELIAVVKQIDTAGAITRHNIANAQTVGYKRIIPGFEADAKLVCHRSFAPGNLTQTSEPWDLAIVGAGFFEVQLPDGRRAYTRAGAFLRSADGRITTSDGYPVAAFQPVPATPTDVHISPAGYVTYTSSGSTTTYQIHLVTFTAPAELELNRAGYYLETEASGVASLGNPDQDGFGQILQGYLELSNVHVVEETARLILLDTWKRDVLKALELKAGGK